MAQKQYVYATSLAWQGDVRGVCSARGLPDLPVAPPAEFGGCGGTWSPEALLVASANACTMATFLYHAGRAGVELIRYRSDAEGVVQAGKRGLAFVSFTVRPSVTVAAGHLAEVLEAMERTRSCLVSNSLAAEVRIEAEMAEAAV